jgi:hypothetical protein
MKTDRHRIGVGATKKLSLRVSVAALVSVLFDHPDNGKRMLGLEQFATLHEIDGQSNLSIRAKAFGGAVRLIDPQALAGLIGTFHYDSKLSRHEHDFRILIHPTSWEQVKHICREHINQPEKKILEISPVRELTEEFLDTLQVKITSDQYVLKSRGMIVQDRPQATHNLRLAGFPTVRIYYLFDAFLHGPELITKILKSNHPGSAEDLYEKVRQVGKRKVNTVLALQLDELKKFYHAYPADQQQIPQRFGEHLLDGNVQALIRSCICRHK